YINGKLVAENGKSKIKSQKSKIINNFSCNKKRVEDFAYILPTCLSGRQAHDSRLTTPVIEALDGQLITNKLSFEPKVVDGKIVSDIERDILKIVVVNRYKDVPIA